MTQVLGGKGRWLGEERREDGGNVNEMQMFLQSSWKTLNMNFDCGKIACRNTHSYRHTHHGWSYRSERGRESTQRTGTE